MSHALRVLIVDDDMTTCMIARRALGQAFDAEVTEAHDGIFALARLVEYPCDLLLLNIRMPTLDGLATLEAIRTSTRCPDLPVLILTAVTDAATVQRCVDLR